MCNKLQYSIIRVIVLLTMVACQKKESNDFDYGDYRYDVVTFDNFTDGTALFSYISLDDAPEVLLEGKMAKAPDIKKGDRVLLQYYGDADKSKNDVIIGGYTKINNDTLRVATDASCQNSEPVKLRSIWRTGNYINIRCEVEYTEASRFFYLLMDRDTWHDNIVHCYLQHNTRGETKYFWRQIYASFYVGAAWKLWSCKELHVHLIDEITNQEQEYIFKK